MRPFWRLILLAVALVWAATSFAQLYVPPVALDRVSVFLEQYGPRFENYLRMILAAATGALIAKEVQNRNTYVRDSYTEYLQAQAEESVSSEQVFPPSIPDEALVAIRDYMLSNSLLGPGASVLTADVARVGEEGRLMGYGVQGSGLSADAARSEAVGRYRAWLMPKAFVGNEIIVGLACHTWGCGYPHSYTEEYGDTVYYSEYPPVLDEPQVKEWPVSGSIGSRGYFTQASPYWALTDAQLEPYVVDECYESGGCRAVAFPSYLAAIYVDVYSTDAYVDVPWCSGSWSSWNVGVYMLRWALSRVYKGPLDWKAEYRVEAAVIPVGAWHNMYGSLPYGDKVWEFDVVRFLPGMDYAIGMAGFNNYLVSSAWARACSGQAVPPGTLRLPWDVERAPDSGVSVRQRDAAEVWWVARPREFLRELFQPSVPLVVRFERLEGVLAERFPFSVAIALRSYVPSVVDQSVEAPCFSVGHGWELCPNPQVLGTVAAASRWGSLFVLGLGVMLWLQRRAVPLLRL
jgi:hypothetical protein